MNESGETPQKPQEAKETYCRFGPEAEKEDTPDAHRIIERYKNDSLEVLETPQNFIESDGGPRCSITSFSI